MPKEKKRGYRLMIQSGLSENQFEVAMKEAQRWREDMENTGYSWKSETSGGWKSDLKRNGHGYVLSSPDGNLVFRRISVKRRIFGIVKQVEIKITKADSEHTNNCFCYECTNKEKYGWASVPPPMYMLFEFGDIKGR